MEIPGNYHSVVTKENNRREALLKDIYKGVLIPQDLYVFEDVHQILERMGWTTLARLQREIGWMYNENDKREYHAKVLKKITAEMCRRRLIEISKNDRKIPIYKNTEPKTRRT